MLSPETLQKIIEYALSGFMGVIGSWARYFHEVAEGHRKFAWVGLIAFSLLGYVVGTAIGEELPAGNYYGLVAVAGFNAHVIIVAIGKRIAAK